MQGHGPVEDLIDDIQKVSKIDDPDGHLTDAVIEKFCDENFGSPEMQQLSEAVLKVGIHSAMEDGLTRDEIIAAISQTGSILNPHGPTVADGGAEEIAGPDNDHLYNGLQSFMDRVGGGAPAATPDEAPRQSPGMEPPEAGETGPTPAGTGPTQAQVLSF